MDNYNPYEQMLSVLDNLSDVVDSTGAGDAFCGAVLYQISQAKKNLEDLSREELECVVRYANAAGALCVRRTGAIPAMPDEEEIKALLTEGSGKPIG